eukprot:PhM_4_TR1170/c0_g1_i1/m.14203
MHQQKYNLAEYGICDEDDLTDDSQDHSNPHATDDTLFYKNIDDDSDSMNTVISMVADYPPLPESQFPQRFDWMQSYCTGMLDHLRSLGDTVTLGEILRLPFPICAFGTLRIFEHNNVFMGLPRDDTTVNHLRAQLERDHQRRLPDKPKTTAQYSYWSPIYVPETCCEGLQLQHCPGVGCKAEFFCLPAGRLHRRDSWN